MKVFISHAGKDAALAGKLAQRLTKAGYTVWDSAQEIASGDNWAKRIGQALDDSDLMVILLTPGALEFDRLNQSGQLRADVEFALGTKRYEGRLFTVFVGPTLKAGKDIPWILLKLPHCQVESAREFPDAMKEIKGMCMASDLSHSNA